MSFGFSNSGYLPIKSDKYHQELPIRIVIEVDISATIGPKPIYWSIFGLNYEKTALLSD